MENCIKCQVRPIYIKKSSLCKKCYMDNWAANKKRNILKLHLPQATAWKSAIDEIDIHIKNLRFQLKIAEATKVRFIEIAEGFLKDAK